MRLNFILDETFTDHYTILLQAQLNQSQVINNDHPNIELYQNMRDRTNQKIDDYSFFKNQDTILDKAMKLPSIINNNEGKNVDELTKDLPQDFGEMSLRKRSVAKKDFKQEK